MVRNGIHLILNLWTKVWEGCNLRRSDARRNTRLHTQLNEMKMKEMIKDSTLVLLLISAVYISVMGITQVNNAQDKQTTDWTNSTQGVQDTMTEAELMLSK